MQLTWQMKIHMVLFKNTTVCCYLDCKSCQTWSANNRGATESYQAITSTECSRNPTPCTVSSYTSRKQPADEMTLPTVSRLITNSLLALPSSCTWSSQPHAPHTICSPRRHTHFQSHPLTQACCVTTNQTEAWNILTEEVMKWVVRAYSVFRIANKIE